MADVLQRGVPANPEPYFEFRRNHKRRFLFAPGDLPDAGMLGSLMGELDRARTLQVADDYCKGRVLYFSRQTHELGWPVNWLCNPLKPSQHENLTHWCDYPTFSPSLGDIKDVWEPSRFACAYWLVRAYALTTDERYPAAFWDLFDSWCRQNPPNRGPNWKCGQETAIRLFAWCFALHGFWNSPSTTPSRVANMVKMIALQAHRIAGNIDFAISQKNNHSISEAVGLLTVGLLFPELRGSTNWLNQGRDIFEREVLRQVYPDGSFVQHSMNYHRVMLHDCLWALRLSSLNGEPIDPTVESLVHRAGDFLFEMLDPESGRVPNYGSNDGALLLPLTAGDYQDYRPTVQAARYLATNRLTIPRGPWDEAVLWLFGPESLRDEPTGSQPQSRRFDSGGYYTIRAQDSWCMVRCHSYRDRPAQVDMLHVDLWHSGENVLGDSGTFKYFAPNEPGMDRYFPDIAAHNSIQIGDTGPLQQVTRFLWMPWPKGRCVEHAGDRFSGESRAYDRPPWNVRHRRQVRRLDHGDWEIADELSGGGRQRIALRWHLADGEYRIDEAAKQCEIDLPFGRMRLKLECPRDFRMSIHRGLQSPTRVSGWTSTYYGERAPRPTLEVAGESSLPLRMITRISFDEGGRV